MTQPIDIWQVMVNGEVYETDFEGLIEWHREGSFHPSDMVKKGSLNWMEAGKVPALRRIFIGGPPAAPGPTDFSTAVDRGAAQHFSGPPTGVPGVTAAPPLQVGGGGFPQPVPGAQGYSGAGQSGGAQAGPTNFTQQGAVHAQDQAFGAGAQFVPPPPPLPHTARAAGRSLGAHALAVACVNHPYVAPKYICRICANTFCAECIRFANGKIPICPLCGDLCKLFEQEQKKAVREHDRRSGFGFGDLGNALAYPFRHPVSLIAGGIFYGLLLIAGIFGYLFAWMILFGCMSLTIRQVAWGRTDRSFMPEDDFSVWDDMIQPGILGIGITLVSWGATVVVVGVLIWSLLGTVADIQKQRMDEIQRDHVVTAQDISDLDSPDQEKANRAAAKIQSSNKIPVSDPNRSDPFVGAVLSYLSRSIPILLLLSLAVLWGVIYYPMALTVAGYTQDFGSVMNPLVGLDTMKRMGLNYVKAFAMYLAVFIVGSAVGWLVGIVTAPFNMPMVGNLPGNVIGGSLNFYFSMVIAFVLGQSLYKSSDRLSIVTD